MVLYLEVNRWAPKPEGGREHRRRGSWYCIWKCRGGHQNQSEVQNTEGGDYGTVFGSVEVGTKTRVRSRTQKEGTMVLYLEVNR